MPITITITDEELTEITTALERLAKAIELMNAKSPGIGKYFDTAGDRLNRALEGMEEELRQEGLIDQ